MQTVFVVENDLGDTEKNKHLLFPTVIVDGISYNPTRVEHLDAGLIDRSALAITVKKENLYG